MNSVDGQVLEVLHHDWAMLDEVLVPPDGWGRKEHQDPSLSSIDVMKDDKSPSKEEDGCFEIEGEEGTPMEIPDQPVAVSNKTSKSIGSHRKFRERLLLKCAKDGMRKWNTCSNYQ